MTNTSLDIKIEYTLFIDGKLIIKSSIFMDIDKEIRKYERLRFKESVK